MSSAINLWLALNPSLLATLFSSGETGSRLPERRLTPLDSISDDRTRAIYYAFQASSVGRDPTERELSEGLRNWFNRGAQCEIARRLGMRGCSVPMNAMIDFMIDEINKRAGAELSEQEAVAQQAAEEDAARERLKVGVVRQILQSGLGAEPPKRGIPTLAARAFEAGQAQQALTANLQSALGGLSGVQGLMSLFANLFPGLFTLATRSQRGGLSGVTDIANIISILAGAAATIDPLIRRRPGQPGQSGQSEQRRS